MIFQMPYTQFPEGPLVHHHTSYNAMRFYIHSNTLRWSSGAMRGREADQWQEQVAALPVHEQIQYIAQAGFEGIEVSRQGYEDDGKQVEYQLRRLTGVEPIVSDNQLHSFFPLQRYIASRPDLRQR